jgi:endonuclease G
MSKTFLLTRFGYFSTFIIACGISFLSCSQTESENIIEKQNSKVATNIENLDNSKLAENRLSSDTIKNLEIPFIEANDQIIKHEAYTLKYNETFEQAEWVAYKLTASETVGLYERSNDFKEDPLVTTASANDNDYAGSGYDRGHLAPAADMGWSEITMQESFYFSNMSPQDPSFNRGIWKKLEELVRDWAVEYDSLYVVTGPILKTGLKTIGTNKVAVPEYYYKVIYTYSKGAHNAIGFVLKNEGSKDALNRHAVSIDSVENFTGINFYANLPDDVETKIESATCTSCWNWNGTNKQISSPVNKKDTDNSTSIQCSGITQAGTRCKRKTSDPSGKCYQHQ